MQSKTIANLKKEVLDAKSKSNTGDIIEGYQNELSGLKADIVKYEDSITKYEKREIDLKEQIAALRIELNDQPQKFDETVIPIINTAMESLVSNKLEKFEEAIKKSLREEIQANNTLIEKKLATTPQLLSVENANKPQDKIPRLTENYGVLWLKKIYLGLLQLQGTKKLSSNGKR